MLRLAVNWGIFRVVSLLDAELGGSFLASPSWNGLQGGQVPNPDPVLNLTAKLSPKKE